MPKKTFFNLSIQKQTNIIDASIRSFAKGSYDAIKISDIIREIGIPRSSFYDYFEDKYDLYEYLIHMIGQRKSKYLNQIAIDQDFYIYLKDLMTAAVRFIIYEPNLNAIGNYFYSDEKLMKRVLGDIEFNKDEAFVDLLLKGQKENYVKTDVNPKFVSKILTILSSQLVLDEMNNDEVTNELREEKISELISELMSFIKFGIFPIDK